MKPKGNFALLKKLKKKNRSYRCLLFFNCFSSSLCLRRLLYYSKMKINGCRREGDGNNVVSIAFRSITKKKKRRRR